MTIVLARRTFAAAGLAVLAFSSSSPASLAQIAQPASPSQVTIPFLANAARPMDLEFEGGGCEVAVSGNRMECTFQQVFLTTSSVAPDTCLVVTNRYQRTFDRDTATRWVSREAPEGVCGLIEVATLQDGGGGRWTMETRKVATKRDAAAMCASLETAPETLSWQNIRRRLPCRFVQPGDLSR